MYYVIGASVSSLHSDSLIIMSHFLIASGFQLV